MNQFASSMIRRRSKLSARAPAGTERNSMAMALAACTPATMRCSLVSSVISQPAPTSWIWAPICDSVLAAQTLRKAANPNGAKVPGRCAVGGWSRLAGSSLPSAMDQPMASIARSVNRQATNKASTPRRTTQHVAQANHLADRGAVHREGGRGEAGRPEADRRIAREAESLAREHHHLVELAV